MTAEERAVQAYMAGDDTEDEGGIGGRTHQRLQAIAAAIRAAETEARARALNEAASMAEEISGEPPWPDFACALRRLAGEGAGRG